MKVTFVSKKLEANNIYTFFFTTPPIPRYIAGQFIEMYLPHANKDSRGDKRWFTLSSSPTEDRLAITTRFEPTKASSFKQALHNLKAGTEVNMIAPMGDFVLPKDPNIPLVFIAGGIGCTPFRSMIKFLQDSNQSRNITMIYAARSADDIAFQDILSKLGKNFHKQINEPLTAKSILNHIKSMGENRTYIYLSGPEVMIQSLRKDLIGSGYPKKYLFSDYFPGYKHF